MSHLQMLPSGAQADLPAANPSPPLPSPPNFSIPLTRSPAFHLRPATRPHPPSSPPLPALAAALEASAAAVAGAGVVHCHSAPSARPAVCRAPALLLRLLRPTNKREPKLVAVHVSRSQAGNGLTAGVELRVHVSRVPPRGSPRSEEKEEWAGEGDVDVDVVHDGEGNDWGGGGGGRYMH